MLPAMPLLSRTIVGLFPLAALVLACGEDGGDEDTTAADTHADHGSLDESGSESSSAGDSADTTTGADGSSEGGTTTEGGSSGTDESSTTGAAVQDTWENWALPQYFQPYCIGCHPGDSPRDFTMYEVVVDNVDHIRCGSAPEMLPDCDDHIEPGHLPIGDGPFPTDDERWRLVDWIDAGMPRDP